MKEEDKEDAPEIWGQPQFILGGHQASVELVGKEVAESGLEIGPSREGFMQTPEPSFDDYVSRSRLSLLPRGQPPEQGQRPSPHPHGHPALHEARGPARLPACLSDWGEPLRECLGWKWPGVRKGQRPWGRGCLDGEGQLNWLGEGGL